MLRLSARLRRNVSIARGGTGTTLSATSAAGTMDGRLECGGGGLGVSDIGPHKQWAGTSLQQNAHPHPLRHNRPASARHNA